MTVKVWELTDGDVFSIDGGLTWHVALVPQFGTVAVWASERRDDEAPTIRIEAARDQEVLRLGVETVNPWVLHYRCSTHGHHVSLHRERAGAIAHLATIVRQKWNRSTDRRILDSYPEPPGSDQAAVNLYFAGLHGQEDYEVRESAVQPTTLNTEPEQEHVEGHSGLDWICLCGNDPTFEGYSTSTATGELVSPDDGAWDRIHYRCMACGRVIAQPTGQVVAVRT